MSDLVERARAEVALSRKEHPGLVRLPDYVLQLCDEVERLQKLVSKRDSYEGWLVVEESPDGSLLLEATSGERRRVWNVGTSELEKEAEQLRAESAKARELLREMVNQPVQLSPGYWRTRAGGKVYVAGSNPDNTDQYPWVGWCDDGDLETWMVNGRCYDDDKERGRDIIAPWTDEPEAEPELRLPDGWTQSEYVSQSTRSHVVVACERPDNSREVRVWHPDKATAIRMAQAAVDAMESK